MALVFPFEESHSTILGTVYRPVAQVLFKNLRADKWREMWMIVDTGADYTLLPRYMAEHLEVDIEHDCKIFHTTGIGGTERVYLLPEIQVRLGEFARVIPVGFIDRNEVPPLLGRHLFMETFEVYFSSDHKTYFSDKPFRQ